MKMLAKIQDDIIINEDTRELKLLNIKTKFINNYNLKDKDTYLDYNKNFVYLIHVRRKKIIKIKLKYLNFTNYLKNEKVINTTKKIDGNRIKHLIIILLTMITFVPILLYLVLIPLLKVTKSLEKRSLLK